MDLQLFSIERMPRELPIWETILEDLGRPAPARVARALGVGESTVYRWNATGRAPRVAALALFWLTRWGHSQVNADAVNDALMAAQLARSYREECNRLRVLGPDELAWPTIEPAAPECGETRTLRGKDGARFRVVGSETSPGRACARVATIRPDASRAACCVQSTQPAPRSAPPPAETAEARAGARARGPGGLPSPRGPDPQCAPRLDAVPARAPALARVQPGRPGSFASGPPARAREAANTAWQGAGTTEPDRPAAPANVAGARCKAQATRPERPAPKGGVPPLPPAPRAPAAVFTAMASALASSTTTRRPTR